MMDPMQAQLDAFNTRELEAFITCFAPDIVIEGPDGAEMMRGHEEMRAMYGQLFAQSPELHCKVTSRIRVGAYAIDEEHTTGFVFAAFPTELHVAVVCRLEGGLIAHMRLLAAESEESLSAASTRTLPEVAHVAGDFRARITPDAAPGAGTSDGLAQATRHTVPRCVPCVDAPAPG